MIKIARSHNYPRKETKGDQTMEIERGRLMKIDEVLNICAVSRSRMYEMVARGEFPSPVRVGARAVAWRQREILEWIESHPQAMNTANRSLTEGW